MVAEYHPAKHHAKIHKLGRGGDEMPTSMYVSSEGVVCYGDEADVEGLDDAQNHIRCFKRLLGTGTLTKFGTKKATPTDLAADFLSHIRQRLESEVFHRPVHHLVLTVPAIFGPAQREDLTCAARRAGFKEVELLQEPVAAGIAYCDHHSDLSQDLRFLVVDWGGGTFDLALVERKGANECRILNEYIDGATDIGGEDLDDDLWEAASGMVVAAGFPALDHQPKQHWGRYRRELTRTKERLSTVDEVPASFTLDKDKLARIPIRRAKLEEVFSEKIQRGARQVANLVARCRKANLAPDFILLAGGTSRIPMIARILEKTAGLQCRSWSEGRDAIALGAAIHASKLWLASVEDSSTSAISAPPPVIECPHCEERIEGITGTGEWTCPECEGELVVTCKCPECDEEQEIEEWREIACPDCGASFNSWKEANVAVAPKPPRKSPPKKPPRKSPPKKPPRKSLPKRSFLEKLFKTIFG
jgi:molecular chaperone DnaK (HSP70)/Zn finger protein HypA/HybF involved in hydrogenase expression